MNVTESAKKALSSLEAQRLIKTRATFLAKKMTDEAKKELVEKFKAKAPQLRKDAIERLGIPTITGVAGQLAADLVFDRFQWASGAKGDVLKILTGAAVSVLGPKVTKTPYLQPAAVGMITISTYKLVGRAFTALGKGKPLSGLFEDDEATPRQTEISGPGETLTATTLQLANGQLITGWELADGSFTGQDGQRYYPQTLNGPEPELSGLSGMPLEQIAFASGGSSLAN
jgi:hypothetical protein